MIRSLEPRLLTTVSLLWRAQSYETKLTVLVAWAGGRVGAAHRLQTDQRYPNVITLRKRTGRRCGSSMLGPTRPTRDLQIQNANRMGWKQTRPSCYTYAPLAPMIKSFLLHLVSKLRMSGVTPLLPLHAVMAWTGKTIHLALQLSKSAS